ncbi:uncharacterized protein K02A2.6-like [Lineus longissimus]|uniref:uncharacterized protein K02A2.6-like n=1 Tax=Lineus longissimus TaxID=88925 RepID=UPI00315D9ADF
MLELQPYDLTVTYSKVPIGDALSRATLKDDEPDMKPMDVNMVDYIAVSKERYIEFQGKTAQELNCLQQIIQKGWPDNKLNAPHAVREYWAVRDELTITDGIIYRGMRIVVPPTMRKEMLRQLHETHQGINKTKRRGREVMYWAGMAKQIEDMVRDCPECNENQKLLSNEPMIGTKTPELPWMKLAADIFHWEGRDYILLIDYFSKYIEVGQLNNLTSKQLIEVFKALICHHGIPQILRADNGTQLVSSEFENFLKGYGIKLVTSSPRYPRSNGEAERAVQTVKQLWCNTKDKQLALLDYRTTPLESCGLSPSQLLDSRRYRTKLPIAKELLKPQIQDLDNVRAKLNQSKQTQAKYYNQKAGRDHRTLYPGEEIRMAPLPNSKKWMSGKVVSLHTSPRSYIVDCGGRKYRRNRKFLRPATEGANKQDVSTRVENTWSEETPNPGSGENSMDKKPQEKPCTTNTNPPSPTRHTITKEHAKENTNMPHKNTITNADKHTTQIPAPSPKMSRFGRVIRAPKKFDI